MFPSPSSCNPCLSLCPGGNLLLLLWCVYHVLILLNFDHYHLFADHEAVSALLRVSPQNESFGTFGTFGDCSSKRPAFMTEEAVMSYYYLLLMIFTNTNYVMVSGWGRASACQCGSEVKNIICSFALLSQLSPGQLQATRRAICS